MELRVRCQERRYVWGSIARSQWMWCRPGRYMALSVSLCVRRSLWFLAVVVTKRPLLIFLKNSSVVDFQYEGKEKKINDKCGQTFKIWLYQEFYLHFVASTNPAVSCQGFLKSWGLQRCWQATAVQQQEQVAKWRQSKPLARRGGLIEARPQNGAEAPNNERSLWSLYRCGDRMFLHLGSHGGWATVPSWPEERWGTAGQRASFARGR